MTTRGGIGTDSELLALAQKVLAGAGFATEMLEHDETVVLLAENAYSIVVLAAIPTMSDLIAAEPHLGDLLQQKVAGVNIGPKKMGRIPCAAYAGEADRNGWRTAVV